MAEKTDFARRIEGASGKREPERMAEHTPDGTFAPILGRLGNGG
jgi:hypothetical protein